MAFMMRKPSPCLDANISASSTPRSVTVRPILSPDTISGSIAGKSTVRTVCACDSFMVRADLR